MAEILDANAGQRIQQEQERTQQARSATERAIKAAAPRKESKVRFQFTGRDYQTRGESQLRKRAESLRGGYGSRL